MKTAINRFFTLVSILVFIFTLPALAAKDSKGVGKEYKSQNKESHEMQHKIKHEEKHGNSSQAEFNKEKSSKEKEVTKGQGRDSDPETMVEPTGETKQSDKKLEQERKETGKGSDIGQRNREEHSRKWWKFWE